MPTLQHKVVGKNPSSAICFRYKSAVWEGVLKKNVCVFQLQHPHPAGHLRLPDPADRGLLLPHEHRPLVQAARGGPDPAAQEGQEEEEEGEI